MRLTEQDVVAQISEISVVQLRTYVARGWIAPTADLAGPTYDEIDIARIRLVYQLHDQLAIDEEALPVVLKLMDQLYGTRRELKALIHAIDQESDEVRQRIRAEFERSMGR